MSCTRSTRYLRAAGSITTRCASAVLGLLPPQVARCRVELFGVQREVVLAAFTQPQCGARVGPAEVALRGLAVQVGQAGAAGAPAEVAVRRQVLRQWVQKGAARGHAPVQHEHPCALRRRHGTFDGQPVAQQAGHGRGREHLRVQRTARLRESVHGAVARARRLARVGFHRVVGRRPVRRLAAVEDGHALRRASHTPGPSLPSGVSMKSIAYSLPGSAPTTTMRLPLRSRGLSGTSVTTTCV